MSLPKLLLGGLASYLPLRAGYTMANHPVDCRYGYAMWLRHLAMLDKHGVRGPFPTVVELGPGNSIATGVSALLSGTDQYIGLDVLEHISMQTNTRVLDQLQQLFQTRAGIPDASEYPFLCPRLDDYAFPAAALSIDGMAASTDPERIKTIREAVHTLTLPRSKNTRLRYIVPWQPESIAPESVDLVLTQAVLQEIPHEQKPGGLGNTIEAIARWLRPGGVVSHQIDFGMYGFEPWNVHWSWSGMTWKLVRGRRDNFVNREPLSTYETLLQRNGLSLIAAETVESEGIPRAQLAPRYRDLPERDLRTRTVTLIAGKR